MSEGELVERMPNVGRTASLRGVSLALLAGLSFVVNLTGTFFVDVWLGDFFFAVRASRYLGYWPRYGHPDPKSLPPELWGGRGLLEYGLRLSIALGLAAIPTILIVRRARPRAWIPLSVVGAVALLVLGLTLWFIDPGGVLDWAFD